MTWFLVNNLFRVIWTWSWFFFIFRFFWSCLSRTKLSSVTSLNLINYFIFHCVSWFIWSWAWDNFIFCFN
jgi:hypothetical protein